ARILLRDGAEGVAALCQFGNPCTGSRRLRRDGRAGQRPVPGRGSVRTAGARAAVLSARPRDRQSQPAADRIRLDRIAACLRWHANSGRLAFPLTLTAPLTI